jgi:hypothetical protein
MKIQDRNLSKLLAQQYSRPSVSPGQKKFGEHVSQLAKELADTHRKISKGHKGEKDTPAVAPTTGTPDPAAVPEEVLSPTPATPATQASTSVSEPEKNDILSLAARYVSAYEKNSGQDLSPEEEKARVADVARFYSEPSRAGRLQTLVNAIG